MGCGGCGKVFVGRRSDDEGPFGMRGGFGWGGNRGRIVKRCVVGELW